MVQIHLIRHAPVIGKSGRIYGDDAAVDLEAVAAEIGALAARLPHPRHSLWYHSGVDRAGRTAKAVLDAIPYDGDPPTPHEGFREQNFGALLGLRHEDITDHLRFIDGKIHAPCPPEGESIPAFVARVGHAMTNVRQQAIEAGRDEIVVFCHGGTIRAAHAALEKTGRDEFICLDTPPLFVYRGALSSYVA